MPRNTDETGVPFQGPAGTLLKSGYLIPAGAGLPVGGPYRVELTAGPHDRLCRPVDMFGPNPDPHQPRG